jgi:hypothetical protein
MTDQLLDGGGVYGALMHYVLFFALFGGALILLIYFWYKGRLDMDESPKIEMMREE